MIKLIRQPLTIDEIKTMNFLDFSNNGHFFMINKRVKDNINVVGRHDRMMTGQLTSFEDIQHSIDIIDSYSEKFNEKLRLYIHVNGFNMEKAIKHFIFTNLDILFKQNDFKKYIYANINASICVKENNFNSYNHWDIDETGDIELIFENIKNIFNTTNIEHIRPFEELLIDYYPTRTGIHMIMKGYNPKIHNDILKIYPNITINNNAFACVYYS